MPNGSHNTGDIPMFSKVKKFFSVVFEVMIEADKKRAEYYRKGYIYNNRPRGD